MKKKTTYMTSHMPWFSVGSRVYDVLLFLFLYKIKYEEIVRN